MHRKQTSTSWYYCLHRRSTRRQVETYSSEMSRALLKLSQESFKDFSFWDNVKMRLSFTEFSKSPLKKFSFRNFLRRWLNLILVAWHYTVKLARAKLPANAGNFTCSSQVKKSLAQFTCVTCSLPVNTGKFTCFEAASTSRRTHANCLRVHVNLPEYHRHFTGSFTWGTHANLPATSMQNCLLLQAKIHATYRQKHWNRR